MTKQESLAYLRKKQLLEKVTEDIRPPTKEETEEVLRELEKSPKDNATE